MANLPTDWTSDGSRSASATGGGMRLPEEAYGVDLAAKVYNIENCETGAGKPYLRLVLRVDFNGETYQISHSVWTNAQFSTIASLAGLSKGARPMHLVGKIYIVKVSLNSKGYINIDEVKALPVPTEAPKVMPASPPKQGDGVPFRY